MNRDHAEDRRRDEPRHEHQTEPPEERSESEEPMRHLNTTLVAAALAAGCSSAANRAPTPTTAQDPRRHAHAAHAHESHSTGGHHHVFADADVWTKVLDDPARDDWQRPGEVLRAMELESAMTVADVGAGTGYFSVRLSRLVPRGKVIATDIEPDMVRFLSERARREGLTNLRAIQGTPEASGLAARSVDRILVVHVWHHLGDRDAYARDLAAALKPGGRLFVVDFQLSAHRGPPEEMRVAPGAVIAALESAGLSAGVSPVVLPDQYIVEAHRRP
ncbi:class I SAM-dependent methyltransferase [Sorangium sp. So ce327]|uniref:class I SAM-dependent methyltransferase n=1 Tax=Sorangium sp. So ce327 TaxID=3133301 RepID=UPI003F648197